MTRVPLCLDDPERPPWQAMSSPVGGPATEAIMGAVRTYSQADFATKLRMPEGIEYVLADSAEEIRDALDKGQAALVESCNGRAFVWREDGKFRVDTFFFGPRRELDYESEDEAVDYASSMCE